MNQLAGGVKVPFWISSIDRPAFEAWNALVLDLQANADGKHPIPQPVQAGLLGIPVSPASTKPGPPPSKPTLSGSIVNQFRRFRVTGQPLDANYSEPAELFVCLWQSMPDSGTSLDCTSGSGSKGSTVQAEGETTEKPYLLADKSGVTDITLKAPLKYGQAISVVQYVAGTKIASDAAGVSANEQCNIDPFHDFYSDCDMTFSIIGGFEQAGLSSQPSITGGFLRVFTRGHGDWPGWAEIRLLSAPQQNSSAGVVSAFADPTGTITTTAVSNVGSSIDYMVGIESPRLKAKDSPFSLSGIAALGGTTPLNSNTITEGFVSPSLGTVECNLLYNKFKKYFASPKYNIGLNDPGNDQGITAKGCLLNLNSPAGSPPKYPTVNTIGFSNQDRTSFLGKWQVGFRTITRFKPSNTVACGTSDSVNHIAPCHRGIVDFTLGQDASITNGQLRHWVFKTEGVHPVPVKGTGFLYLFGAFSMRFEHNLNSDPLILQPASSSSLTGTGSSAVPNINTVVLPLQQPDRDFYRFGVGVDVMCIFSKVFTAGSDCLSSSNSGSGSTSSQ